MGGNSPEYEVSISSGKNILENIDKDKYNVFSLTLSRSGGDDDLKKLIDLNKTKKIDICFIAMHGPYGEDGSLQKKLDEIGIKYTGSGSVSSKLGMNKISFKSFMNKNKVMVPRHLIFRKGEDISKFGKKVLFPCFVKPTNQGSSVGADRVISLSDFQNAIKVALKYDNTILVDEYISGMEITVPMLGNNKPRALPIIEIRPKKGMFFNYESKYSVGGAEEIVPANLSLETTKKIQRLAEKIFKLSKCRGFARIDFILKNNLGPVVLEINTIPGLTKMSLFPKSALAAGINMTQLIDKIIEYALE